jgi:hypothetical protein
MVLLEETMKFSTIRVSAIAMVVFLLAAHGAFADDAKQISDGAAKGQASEGTVPTTNGKGDERAGVVPSVGGLRNNDATHHSADHRKSHSQKHAKGKKSAKGKADMAVKGSGVPKNTSKNISDGAAKGQATE